LGHREFVFGALNTVFCIFRTGCLSTLTYSNLCKTSKYHWKRRMGVRLLQTDCVPVSYILSLSIVCCIVLTSAQISALTSFEREVRRGVVSWKKMVERHCTFPLLMESWLVQISAQISEQLSLEGS